MDYAAMKLTDVARLPGVTDLPMRIKGRFAQALKAEADGDHEKAEACLKQAIEAEAEIAAA